MKRIYVFILLSVMVISLTTCIDNDRQNNGYMCRYLLVNLGDLDGDYLIDVTDSGVMTISSGRLSDDLYEKILYEDKKMTESLYDYIFFKEVRTKETIKLTPVELGRLRKCISKIENVRLVNPFVQSSWKDAEAHIIVVNGNKSVFVMIPSEDFSEFLKTLFELTHREWRDYYGRELRLDYKESLVHECQVPDSIKKSCWEKVKGWFD